ncbi:PAS domain-containing protein, partial [Escherichia coli]|nr:PAS domain-containing protein [Escherichia coli]
IDEQGTVLFASRVLARLLGQEPEAMEGQPLNEWLATPLQQQWPDLASEREHNLEFLVAGQKDVLNARALPIALGGQAAFALTL